MSNFKLLFIAILIVFDANLSLQDQPCELPNGDQSTCIRIHRCDNVWSIVQNYTNDNMPPNITALINKHAIECPQSNYVCCPYESDDVIPLKAIKTATKPPMTLTLSNNDICYLPKSNRQSKCVSAQNCTYIMNLVRPYHRRYLIPENVTKHINDYKCPESKGLNYYCCPDNAIYHFQRSNLSTLKRHSNINLINHNSCGPASTNRIVGGEYADLLEFPWAVLLGHYDDNGDIIYSCGGTLISSQYVLTAAHCVTNTLILAILGEHTIGIQRDCQENDCEDPVQEIGIESKKIHPDFDPYLRVNDIALLKLASPADTTRNNVKTICLPIHDEINFDEIVKNPKQNFTISGWGVTSEDKKRSDILKKASVRYVNHDECSNKYKNQMTIRSIHLCAGGESNKTCRGDSGGGATALANLFGRPKEYLYGVISGGLECENENSNYPSISTNIAFYLKWILDNMSPTSIRRYSSNNDFAFVYEE